MRSGCEVSCRGPEGVAEGGSVWKGGCERAWRANGRGQGEGGGHVSPGKASIGSRISRCSDSESSNSSYRYMNIESVQDKTVQDTRVDGKHPCQYRADTPVCVQFGSLMSAHSPRIVLKGLCEMI